MYIFRRLLLVLVILISAAGYGQTSQSIYKPLGGYFDFTALTAAGSTSMLDLRQGLVKTHTVEVSVTGSPSTCTFSVQGSSNGTNWYDLSGTQQCTSNLMIHIDPKPVRFLRMTVLTFTGTGSLLFQWTGL